MADTKPVDYGYEARLKKAGDLADRLMIAGWEPGTELTGETWKQATLATGRTVKGSKGMPSEETKAMTLTILEARWKERQSK